MTKGGLLIRGDAAPQFETVDVFGESVSLRSFKNRAVLLVFLRYSGCPWCNLTIHRLVLEYPLLHKNNCDVVAFIQSSAANIKKNIYQRHAVRPQFPIIADPDKKHYEQYGVGASALAAVASMKAVPDWLRAVYTHGFHQAEVDGNLMLVPAQFLIGVDEQRLLMAEYGTSYYKHQTFTEIYEQLTFDTV